MEEFTTTPSSLLNSELHSTLHDRQRRNQRMIGKEDQLRARRYGMCELGRNGRLKYTYNGKILIWCPVSNRAITCWNVPPHERGPETSGTSHTDPILIQKSHTHTSPYAETAHSLVSHQIRNQLDKWKSHTVLVVDMSGSMRTDDVDGARCRSDGVWTCLAKDFVKKQVEEGKTSLHDLVSVVLMRDTAEVVLECEPTDYVLYNKLVDLREWSRHRPGGHGNYEPALEKAEELLNKNRSGSCAVCLFFFSDGRPSDANKQELPNKMGALASRFGRRLTVTCVGMANHQKEDFSILEKMVHEAKAYGAVASFNKPSMDANSLSSIISTQMASSLTSTKTELTNLSSGKSMTVRTDLVRERQNAPDDLVPNFDWRMFNTSSMYTVQVWAWANRHTNRRQNYDTGGEFCRLIDPRCASCYKVTVLDPALQDANPQKGKMCSGCRACFFCHTCLKNRAAGRSHPKSVCEAMASARRKGEFMLLKETCNLPSFSVAWKRQCFGEGAERVAFKFRYLDDEGDFTGPRMVAKESRFVDKEDLDGIQKASLYLSSSQHKYHRTFMRTQFCAAQCADKFNETLRQWENHLDDIAKGRPDDHALLEKCRFYKARIRRYPRVQFLQPRIFELVDRDKCKTFNVLVEPMIEGNYRKYNNNNGGLVGGGAKFQSPFLPPQQSPDGSLNPSLVQLLLGSKENANDGQDATASLGGGTSNAVTPARGANNLLGAIAEGDSDEEEEDESDEEDENHAEGLRAATNNEDQTSPGRPRELFERIVQEGDWSKRKLTTEFIPDEDFMQAFSHFSFVQSRGRLIVVDLQGSLSVCPKVGTKEFVLTDPAIHKRKKSKFLKNWKFGRTDRGDRGIKDFFATHVCNDACRLFGLKEKKEHQKYPYY